jgi:hypothetical protein
MRCGISLMPTFLLLALACPFFAYADDPAILIDTGGLLGNSTRLPPEAGNKIQSICGMVTGNFGRATARNGSILEVLPPPPTYQVSYGDSFKLVTKPDFAIQSLHKVSLFSIEFSLWGITYHSDASSDALCQILPEGMGGQLRAENLIGSNRSRQNFWIGWRCPTSSHTESGLPRFHLIARKTPCHGEVCPFGFRISPMIEELNAGVPYQLLRPSLVSPNDADAADFADGKIAYVIDAFVDYVPDHFPARRQGIPNTLTPKLHDPVIVPFRILGTESRTSAGRAD